MDDQKYGRPFKWMTKNMDIHLNGCPKIWTSNCACVARIGRPTWSWSTNLKLDVQSELGEAVNLVALVGLHLVTIQY